MTKTNIFSFTSTVIGLSSAFALTACDPKQNKETSADGLYRTDTLIYPKVGDAEKLDTLLLKVGIKSKEDLVDTQLVASTTPPYDLVKLVVRTKATVGRKSTIK
jgi:hypothetical protein